MIESSTFLNCYEIKDSFGATPFGDYIVNTDSRTFNKGEAFVALFGESFDGSKFLKSILEIGCSLVVVSSRGENLKIVENLKEKYEKTAFLIVDDTNLYLQKLATYHARIWRERNPNRKIIGITGSNGKTTTKNMLYHLLKNHLGDAVICTEKNFNNHFGVPYTLLKISEQTKYVVLEMGTNHPGEIALLCEIASPDCGIITSIGLGHIEFFKDEEAVFVEKRSLFDSVMIKTGGKGLFCLNELDPFLKRLSNEENVKFFGPYSTMYNTNLKFDQAELNYCGERFTLKNELLTGAYNYSNLVSAFIMAMGLDPLGKNSYLSAIDTFVPVENRSSWMNWNERPVFLDAYNANPSSMKAALTGLTEYLDGKRVDRKKALLVLGDMNELGDRDIELHEEIGELIFELGFEKPVFVGRYTAAYQRGCGDQGRVFESTEECQKEFKNISEDFEVIFIKASRSLHLESLVDINVPVK